MASRTLDCHDHSDLHQYKKVFIKRFMTIERISSEGSLVLSTETPVTITRKVLICDHYHKNSWEIIPLRQIKVIPDVMDERLRTRSTTLYFVKGIFQELYSTSISKAIWIACWCKELIGESTACFPKLRAWVIWIMLFVRNKRKLGQRSRNGRINEEVTQKETGYQSFTSCMDLQFWASKSRLCEFIMIAAPLLK